MNSLSESLLATIREAKTRFVRDYSVRQVLLDDLSFLYDTCVASQGLLLDAAIEAKVMKDAFREVLWAYYLKHYDEEKGEIELLLADMASAGIKPSWPDPTAVAMIGAQYYLLKHVHPVCLLGYLAIMEADPVPLAVVEKLEAAHGVDLFRFLRLHAIRDLEHARDLIVLIDKVPHPLVRFVEASTENALKYLGVHYAG